MGKLRIESCAKCHDLNQKSHVRITKYPIDQARINYVVSFLEKHKVRQNVISEGKKLIQNENFVIKAYSKRYHFPTWTDPLRPAGGQCRELGSWQRENS